MSTLNNFTDLLKSIADKMREIEGTSSLIKPNDFINHLNNYELKSTTPDTCTIMISAMGDPHRYKYTEYINGQTQTVSKSSSSRLVELRQIVVNTEFTISNYLMGVSVSPSSAVTVISTESGSGGHFKCRINPSASGTLINMTIN